MSIQKLLSVLLLACILSFAGCSGAGGGGGSTSIKINQGSTLISSGGVFDFGSVVAGTSGSPIVFTIKNTGTSSVTLDSSALAVTGTNASDFAPAGLASGSSIPAGGSTTFTVTFGPTSVGAESASVALASDAGTYRFTVNGTGGASGELVVKYYDGDGYSPIVMGDDMNVYYAYSWENPFRIRVYNSDIANTLYPLGSSPLTITNNTGLFSISVPLSTTPISPGSYGEFEITLALPPDNNPKVETVTLSTSDPTHHPFTFAVVGHQC